MFLSVTCRLHSVCREAAITRFTSNSFISLLSRPLNPILLTNKSCRHVSHAYPNFAHGPILTYLHLIIFFVNCDVAKRLTSLRLLLLEAGDIHPNPGPSESTSTSSDSLSDISLNMLNSGAKHYASEYTKPQA